MLSLVLPQSSHAQDIPSPTAPVVDSAQIIPADVEATLNQILRGLKNRGIQMGVLTVKSLEGLSIEGYSIKVADKWQLGDATTDKGLILLVAPKERKVRFEVGQGLEGDFPDAYSKRVIDYDILPHFKNGDYSSGILSGVLSSIKYVAPEYLKEIGALTKDTRPPVQKKKKGLSIFQILIILLILSLRFGLFGFGGLGRGSRVGRGGFGGGGFGGGGGGSWGGGGGGFSGGGSSGSW